MPKMPAAKERDKQKSEFLSEMGEEVIPVNFENKNLKIKN